jgi:hypothetical protein
MVAVLLSAVPQVVQVFAMQGIPFTKILISIFVIAFTVPEALRVVAGLEDAKELQPLPIVSRANAKLQGWNCTILGICFFTSLPIYYVSLELGPWHGDPWSRSGSLFFTSFALGVSVSILVKVALARLDPIDASTFYLGQFL